LAARALPKTAAAKAIKTGRLSLSPALFLFQGIYLSPSQLKIAGIIEGVLNMFTPCPPAASSE